jgi:hypothetical protein
VGAGLAAALVLSGLVAAASALHEWGRQYEEKWALRKALALQPWRTSAVEELAEDLALDGRAGRRAAAVEARSLIRDTVSERPWDPQIRLVASDVEALLRNQRAADRWFHEQVERFPGDRGRLHPPEQIAGDGSPGASSTA